MCVIIYVPKGKKIMREELQDAFDYNDDGCGMAWIKDNKVFYSKGYTKFNLFYDAMEYIINDDSIDRVFHFRITSRGTTNKYQTHPFMLSDNVDDMKILDYVGETPVLFMNGTITNQKLIKGLNDTASFIINDLVGSSLDFNNSKDLKFIDKCTGAKWAIVETTGVTLIGNFDEDCGIYYSNLYHRWYNNLYTKSTYTYTNSILDYDYDYDLDIDECKDECKDCNGINCDYCEKGDWYGEWLQKEYGNEIADVYYDCLYYDRLTPYKALAVALECYQEMESMKSDDYDISYDDCFYYDYTLQDLIDEDDAPLLDNNFNYTNTDLYEDIIKKSKKLSDYFPNKKNSFDDKVDNLDKQEDWLDCTLKSLKELCGIDGGD